MSRPVDLELKKAFVDLQLKMVATSKKIHEIDTEVESLKFLLDQAKLSTLGISYIAVGTNVYEGVGRMFLQRDIEKLRKGYKDRVNELEVLIKDLQDNKIYLGNNLKESENNIREMVQLRKEQFEEI